MTRPLESAGRHCDSIMSEFSVICSLIHRPSLKAVFCPVPVCGTSALSAARAARRFAWPLRDREAFRRAGGCAVPLLRPCVAGKSKGWLSLLSPAQADAGRRRNPRSAQFGMRSWPSVRPAKTAGRVAFLIRCPAGSSSAMNLLIVLPGGASMAGRRRAPRILAADSLTHTLL